ncbi:MAG: EamA family transporter [Fidelibacterota bacterium]
MRLIAVFQALFVTFLWSTSFIIIKWGLAGMPPITFAGLRYGMAFACFVPFVLRERYLSELKDLTRVQWWKLVLLGIVFYAVTVSLLLNFTPLIVTLSGIFLLKEIPRSLQWTGVLLFMAGMLVSAAGALPVQVRNGWLHA